MRGGGVLWLTCFATWLPTPSAPISKYTRCSAASASSGKLAAASAALTAAAYSRGSVPGGGRGCAPPLMQPLGQAITCNRGRGGRERRRLMTR